MSTKTRTKTYHFEHAIVDFTERRIEFENGPAGATYSDVRFEHRWHLRGGNGESMATSEAYTTAADARRGLRDAVAAMTDVIFAILQGEGDL
jgi:hypothetical protein